MDAPSGPSTVLSTRRPQRALRIIVDCAIWVFALGAGVLLRLDFNVDRFRSFNLALLIPVARATLDPSDPAGSARRGWHAWLAVRDACPVGREHRFQEDHIRYGYAGELD